MVQPWLLWVRGRVRSHTPGPHPPTPTRRRTQRRLTERQKPHEQRSKTGLSQAAADAKKLLTSHWMVHQKELSA